MSVFCMLYQLSWTWGSTGSVKRHREGRKITSSPILILMWLLLWFSSSNYQKWSHRN